jgi:type I restriction enzyme, S subunit
MESEWQETKLGEFAHFNYGKGLPKRKRNSEGSIPVYGSNGITGYHDEPLIDKGIIIGRKGSIGEVEYSPEPFWPIDTTFYVEDRPDRDLRFTYYLLKSLPLQEMNSDSAVPGLNRDAALSLKIQVPSLKEQKRIAHILGTFDDKIELNQRMNETLEAIARAVFKSWFVDFDPVRAKMAGEPYPLPDAVMALFPDALVESELGMIPKGWEVGVIQDIAEVTVGGDWGKEDKFENSVKVRCLRGTDLETIRKFGYSSKLPERWIKKSSLAKRSINEFDIVIASSGVGPLGRPLWINPYIKINYYEPLTYSNFTKRIRSKTKENAIFLDQILFEMRVSKKIWKFATGTSIPNLDIISLVTQYKILIPDGDILRLFAEKVKPNYKMLYSNENRFLSKIRETYSGIFFGQMNR